MLRKGDSGNRPSFHTALICSPSEDDARRLASVLHGLKVRCVAAATSADALDLAREHSFALILVDLDCDSQWKSTLQKLQTCSPAAGLLAYSKVAGQRVWLDALDAGAFDFLCKPFRRGELHWVIENTLKSRPRRNAA